MCVSSLFSPTLVNPFFCFQGEYLLVELKLTFPTLQQTVHKFLGQTLSYLSALFAGLIQC